MVITVLIKNETPNRCGTGGLRVKDVMSGYEAFFQRVIRSEYWSTAPYWATYVYLGKARDFKNHVTPAVFSFVVTSTYV